MQKNDIIKLEITGMTSEGVGVGRYDGKVVFVPSTAVGDILDAHILKVKKSVAYAKIKQIIECSPDREPTECEVSSHCGGCVYQHINYDAECRIKHQMVEQNIKRIAGIDLPAQPIIKAVSIKRYRNKAQYPVSQNGSVGFYAGHSHRIVETPNCLLQPEIFSDICQKISQFVIENDISVYNETTNKGLLRHIYIRIAEATGEIMVVAVINGDKIPKEAEFIKILAKFNQVVSIQININKDNTNVILGDQCRLLYGKEYITDIICGIKVNLSPLSFYQVNRQMAEILYKKVAEYAEPNAKKILDLYCGTGTIGLFLAGSAESVIGVEIIPQAVQDAKINAAQNDIKNIDFICGDASFAAKQLAKQKTKIDVVIVDPPRKGCDGDLLEILAQEFSPKSIVYVSCDSATLARDCGILNGLGYKLKEYTPVDLFPRTAHVETVVLMVRVEK